MIRRMLPVAATAVLGVAVNLATDNLDSAAAWGFVAAAVVLATLATWRGDARKRDEAKIKGKSNVVTQQGARMAKLAKIRGDSNHVTQDDR